MKRFFNDYARYRKYAKYASVSQLKSEVANSYLNWIWWILNPICFMFIYIFIALIVFGKNEDYFPIFVFLGITCWDFFSRTVRDSVKIIRKNKSIISKIYIPKQILVIITLYVNAIKMIISWGIIILMLIAFRVHLTFNILYLIPLLITLVLFTFGVSLIVMNIGVYIADFTNVVDIILKLAFYMTGIFYSVYNRVPAPYNEILIKVNPVAYLIESMRGVLLYSESINYIWLIVVLLISFLLCVIGIEIVYKNENNYVKVI